MSLEQRLLSPLFSRSAHVGHTPKVEAMQKSRVLFVDNDDELRTTLQEGLEKRGFEVTPAATVNAALGLISIQRFDVLLCDLHLPDAGDGFTIVSAMRHTQPAALTLVLSDNPAVKEAVSAIRLQADEILISPSLNEVAEVIQEKLSNPSAHMEMNKERVAAILEREAGPTIQTWLSKVERDQELAVISLSTVERTGHLELILEDLVRRLRRGNHTAFISSAAHEHGTLRRMQGYTIPMIVEESRLLQVCIFNTLQNNLDRLDFDNVLLDVMAVADEVDSQLKQAVLGFSEPLVELSACHHA
jgi:ActR/RegA family two-component response regulator